jgi:hypothetical protein
VSIGLPSPVGEITGVINGLTPMERLDRRGKSKRLAQRINPPVAEPQSEIKRRLCL